MNYMLLIYQEELAPDAQDMNHPRMRGCEGLAERLDASGHLIAGGILQTTASATSVRLREGHRVVTDGPFAETKEQLAGYMLIKAKNLDEAIAIAIQHPVAQWGTVEIRPLREIPLLVGAGEMEAAR